MNTILGKQIQALRKQAGITQEELGNAVGVSTQAVSKWECGGAPDALLLPRIADFFHVSIDFLFGRNDDRTMAVSDIVYERLQALERKQQLKEAFEICYMIENAIAMIPHKNALPKAEEMYTQEEKRPLFYSVLYNDVCSQMKLNKNHHYFLLMPEPKDGYLSVLPSIEDYKKLINYLSMPYGLEVLFLLYSHRYQLGYSAQRLADKLNGDVGKIQAVLDESMKWGIVHSIDLDQEDGPLTVYGLHQRIEILPMLVLMGTFMEQGAMYGYFAIDREHPLLTKYEEKEHEEHI